MASPLPSGKQSVNLAAPGARGSRIRRDPPPKVKEKPARDPKELERRDAVIGVLVFTLVICVTIFAFSAYSARPARQYKVEVTIAD